MSIDAYIKDRTNELEARVDDDSGAEEQALVVATRPLKTYSPKTVSFAHDTYGIEMAQDAAYGAGELLIHDGTDTAAWTFSEPVGTKWIADSTDRAYDGTKALKCDNPNIGDIMQVINNVGPGDDIDMTGNYVALTMWINVDKDWAGGDSISVYAHVGGALVGNAVYLENYFASGSYDNWQYIDIPLTDMGIEASSIDAFRFENEAREGGKSPKFYIDELTLQASGEPIDFEIEPDPGTWFHIKSFQTTFVDAYSADNADSTMPHLSYDQILGMTPTVGFVREQYRENKANPVSRKRFTNLMDMLSLHGATITNHISDGTNTLITVTQDLPEGMIVTLKSENLDRIVYYIEDDFSQLLYFRVTASGYVETR
jgi:hypothetical protein